jgi:hypothetical protein
MQLLVMHIGDLPFEHLSRSAPHVHSSMSSPNPAPAPSMTGRPRLLLSRWPIYFTYQHPAPRPGYFAVLTGRTSPPGPPFFVVLSSGSPASASSFTVQWTLAFVLTIPNQCSCIVVSWFHTMHGRRGAGLCSGRTTPHCACGRTSALSSSPTGTTKPSMHYLPFILFVCCWLIV